VAADPTGAAGGAAPSPGAAEAEALRQCLRDMIGLLALPSLCHGRSPPEALELVVDALAAATSARLAYARLGTSAEVEAVRLAGDPDARRSLGRVRDAVMPCLLGRPSAPVGIEGPGGLGPLRAAFVPLGFYAETGALVLASDRADFPRPLEAIVMRAGASLAAAALEGALLFAAAQRDRARAEESNRLKDEFLAQLSHELRTPLNAIVGWVHLLRGGTLDGPKRERALETVERNARAQTQLIDDLLDVARITSGKLRLEVGALELAGLVESAIDAARPAAEAKGLRLEAALDPAAGPVVGDSERLLQVFGNLLTNAIKFTPRGGEVRVELAPAGPWAEIAVADTGQGIAPDFLPLVFERFRQADGSITRAHGGLGLGLSIVKHLVELHGGTVAAESEGPGRGARFVVRLPAAAGR
jgi:signal transduction histidine kinase